MLGSLGKRHGFPEEVAQTEAPQFLFAVEWELDSQCTTCIDVEISMARMPWNFALRGGKVLSSRILDGHTCLFMGALDFVLVVSTSLELTYKQTLQLIRLKKTLP
jgi:hypothetical protein